MEPASDTQTWTLPWGTKALNLHIQLGTSIFKIYKLISEAGLERKGQHVSKPGVVHTSVINAARVDMHQFTVCPPDA